MTISAVSKDQLAWLRSKRTADDWGLSSSRSFPPPEGFKSAEIADALERAARHMTRPEQSIQDPMLVCESCKGFTRHHFKMDRERCSDNGRVQAIEHLYECECGQVRLWGLSAPPVGSMRTDRN